MRLVECQMRRSVALACSFLALMPFAMTSRAAIAQCYGPECAYRSRPPVYFNERSTPNSYADPDTSYRSRSGEPDDGPRNRSGSASIYDDAARYRSSSPRPNGYDSPPYRAGSSDDSRYRAYENWRYERPQPRIGLERAGQSPTAVEPRTIPPGVAAPQDVSDRRRLVRNRPNGPDGGEVVIPMSEYRALQSQSRELQRILHGIDLRDGRRAPPADDDRQ